jgi:hypothetical protein
VSGDGEPLPDADRPARAKFSTITVGQLYDDETAASTTWSVPADVAAKITDLLRKWVGPPYSARMLNGRPNIDTLARAYADAGVIAVNDPGEFREYPPA